MQLESLARCWLTAIVCPTGLSLFNHINILMLTVFTKIVGLKEFWSCKIFHSLYTCLCAPRYTCKHLFECSDLDDKVLFVMIYAIMSLL